MPNVMIVTGGSRGIGAAPAILGATAGYAVDVNYASNRDAADKVVAAIEAGGGSAIAVKGDVGVEADILALFEAADRVGTLTALVNNAGVVDAALPRAEMSAARLERMFRINVPGSLLCAREAVRRMATRRGGNEPVMRRIARLGDGWFPRCAATEEGRERNCGHLAKNLLFLH